MKIFSVGGSVRDKLMGLTPNDHDYVVVGSTPTEMESLGFKQVGKDFPVFLHPETGEEYALARFERKTGVKHTDFETSFEPTVTIEEDLRRRDLTINAIAMTESGELVDPFDGVGDIKDKILRHVSSAFGEDPLRILRLARFKARFPEFTIAEPTEMLCWRMVNEGELVHISQDRIWAETKKAFLSKSPVEFLLAMQRFGALKYINCMEAGTYFDEAFMGRVCLLTGSMPEEKQLLIRAAAFFAYYFTDFPSKKEFIKVLREAKVPVDIIELATFVGEHFDELGFKTRKDTTPKELVEKFDRMGIKAMVAKNPEFMRDMFIILAAEFTQSVENYFYLQRYMEAYLDTKEFLSCEMKRFKWSNGRDPKPDEIKEMLQKIKLENLDAITDMFWGGVYFDLATFSFKVKEGKLKENGEPND